MQNILKKLLGVALVAFVVLAPARSALAGPPHDFVVFGDSLSDSGNAFVLLRKLEVPPFDSLIPDAPYARGALHFSNGPTWIEQLSLLEHALPSAGPALLVPKVFSNYAVGGARARKDGPADLSAQVTLFLTVFKHDAPAKALYVLWVGGDDVRDALEALAGDRTGMASQIIVDEAVKFISDNVVKLYKAGARRFLVLNVPDIGLTPAVRLLGDSDVQGAARFYSSYFNGRLQDALDQLIEMSGVEIVRLDVFALLDDVVKNPGAVGLTDVQDPCIALNTRVNAYCAKPGQFLFWDGIHPTVAGHRIVARAAKAALDPKSTLAAMR